MNATVYAKRREHLRREMHAQGLAALLVTLDANRFYLSGFELEDHQVNESSGCILVTADGKDRLCTDARYHDAAKSLWDEEHIFIYGAGAAKALNQLVRDTVSGPVGFEASVMSVAFHKDFSEGLETRPADGLVEKLRVIKDADEIALIEASAALNHKLMEWVPGILTPGTTEKDLAWQVEKFFREHGAQSLAFPCITAIGRNAALPHAIPGDLAITENTCVLVDVGCRMNDYCSDQTRTFWVGDRPSAVFLDTIQQVRTAQEKAMAAIRPGAVASDIYAVAKKHLDDQGVGAFFTHGLGHGVGLQTHESPSLNPRSTTILQPGMIVTVEPGLYYPEWGGVRWEYMVLVTEDGCRIL